jgi:hypothetical protein
MSLVSNWWFLAEGGEGLVPPCKVTVSEVGIVLVPSPGLVA